MKDFQIVMLIGLVNMAICGIVIMYNLHHASRLQAKIGTESSDVDFGATFKQIKIIQTCATSGFIVGFVLMAVAAGMR